MPAAVNSFVFEPIDWTVLGVYGSFLP